MTRDGFIVENKNIKALTEWFVNCDDKGVFCNFIAQLPETMKLCFITNDFLFLVILMK